MAGSATLTTVLSKKIRNNAIEAAKRVAILVRRSEIRGLVVVIDLLRSLLPELLEADAKICQGVRAVPRSGPGGPARSVCDVVSRGPPRCRPPWPSERAV